MDLIHRAIFNPSSDQILAWNTDLGFLRPIVQKYLLDHYCELTSKQMEDQLYLLSLCAIQDGRNQHFSTTDFEPGVTRIFGYLGMYTTLMNTYLTLDQATFETKLNEYLKDVSMAALDVRRKQAHN